MYVLTKVLMNIMNLFLGNVLSWLVYICMYVLTEIIMSLCLGNFLVLACIYMFALNIR